MGAAERFCSLFGSIYMDPEDPLHENVSKAYTIIQCIKRQRPDLYAAIFENSYGSEGLAKDAWKDLKFDLPPHIKELRTRRNAAKRAKTNCPTAENNRNLRHLQREVKAAVARFREQNELFYEIMHARKNPTCPVP